MLQHKPATDEGGTDKRKERMSMIVHEGRGVCVREREGKRQRQRWRGREREKLRK